MSHHDVQQLLSFFLKHHMEMLPQCHPDLKLFKYSNQFNNSVENSTRILVNSELVINELEMLVDEFGSCEFSDQKYDSWLWKVLCLNEKCTYERIIVTRDDERERKDSDLVKMGEWLLKNCKSDPNVSYSPNSNEEYHILYVCANSGSVDKVKLLLKYGSDKSRFSKLRFYHEKPISTAFYNKNLSIVKELCSGDYYELLELGWYELMD